MEALACGVRCSTTRKNKKTPFIHVGANMVVDITIKEHLHGIDSDCNMTSGKP